MELSATIASLPHRLRFAKLRHQASPGGHRLSQTLAGSTARWFVKLVVGDWIAAHDNLVITGPTGVGKSWLACALGHKACRDDRSVLYQRVPKLFTNLALARVAMVVTNACCVKLGGVQLLILDDWGLEPLDAHSRATICSRSSKNATGDARRSYHQPAAHRQLASR